MEILLLSLLVGFQAPPSLLAEWHQNPANGHWYALTPPLPWPAAEALAVRVGGHLATVRSSAENDWIYQEFCQQSVGGCWLGLHDSVENGVFRWTSGEFALFQGWDERNVLNTAPKESYVHIQGGQHPDVELRGRWNDLPADGDWLGPLPGLIEMPHNPDRDHDGVLDAEEIALGLDPKSIDSDGDGLADGWELGLRPWNRAVARQAPNVVSQWMLLDPTDPDCDDDGLLDGVEVGPDAADGMLQMGFVSHPLDADSDDDGLADGEEDRNHNGLRDPGETSPMDPDSDGDGLPDGLELGRTQPLPDTDLTRFRPDRDPSTTTDPLRADSDGGGRLDGEEDASGDGAQQLGEGDPAQPNDDLLTVEWQESGADLMLNCHGLRPGCEVQLLYAMVREEHTDQAEAASGNPRTTGLGVALDLHGTAVLLYHQHVAGERLRLRLRLPQAAADPQGIPAPPLRLQLVETYPWGGARKSAPFEWHAQVETKREKH